MKKISEPSVKGIFTRLIKSQLKNRLVGGNKAFKFSKNLSDAQMTKIAHSVIDVYNNMFNNLIKL